MSQGDTAGPRRPAPVRTLTVVMGVLITIVLVFFVRRVATDWPNIIAGTVPDDDLAELYVAHPWLAYGHIVPGVVYLVLAPLQLSRRFRTRHYTLHRRLGRVLVACALFSGVLAVVLGFVFAWGGAPETRRDARVRPLVRLLPRAGRSPRSAPGGCRSTAGG